VVVQDELHIAKRQLSATEERCDALSAKVSLLQNHISTCVDECGAALEVERELRYEVEERVRELLCETTALKGQAKVIECKAECKRTSMGAWKETDGQVDPMSGIVVAVFERCDTLEEENLKLIRELSENVVTHEGLQTEVNKLKEDVVRYEKIVTGLQMKEKERTVDMRLKTQAGRVHDLFTLCALLAADGICCSASPKGRGRERS
jgi:chromosome segregation ATPase